MPPVGQSGSQPRTGWFRRQLLGVGGHEIGDAGQERVTAGRVLDGLDDGVLWAPDLADLEHAHSAGDQPDSLPDVHVLHARILCQYSNVSANDMSGSWEPVWSISNGRTDVDPSALYENDRGRWEVPAPVTCPAGHDLGPGRVLIGHRPCTCGTGHRSYRCRTCDATIFWPPLGPKCIDASFDARTWRARS